MIVMLNPNSANIDRGVLTIDRKFLSGMNRYTAEIRSRILSVHPKTSPTDKIMDSMSVPCSELGFEVTTLDPGGDAGKKHDALGRLVAGKKLVLCNDLGSARTVRQLGVPYTMTLECDLRTQIQITSSQVDFAPRKWVRSVRCAKNFFARQAHDMRGATLLHCNGYPAYDEAEKYNSRRLLYLDSRMSESMVVPKEVLHRRFAGRPTRPVRLLFSGRYDPIKGAVDVVRVALNCLKNGLDIELHCYGEGHQKTDMIEMARAAGRLDKIHVHDSIPYPELVERSREFDLFVCCHVQGDPSCTYLESFGSGLPIVGYNNRMWERLCKESGVGYSLPMGDPDAVAKAIGRIMADHDTFDAMSLKAREFALSHAFEREFSLRTSSINDELARLGG